MSAVEYGPARYQIVYRDGHRGSARTLEDTIVVLAHARRCIARRHKHGPPVRVEPVKGSEFRATWADLPASPAGWHSIEYMLGWLAQNGFGPLSGLELRSPVQS